MIAITATDRAIRRRDLPISFVRADVVAAAELAIELLEWPDATGVGRGDSFEDGDPIGIAINQHLDIVRHGRESRLSCEIPKFTLVAKLDLHAEILASQGFGI